MRADVAIVGGGAAGALVARALARRGVRPVVWLGREASFGRGVAYGTRLPGHLLNVRASRLGADEDDPGGFARWLECEGDTYAPRHRYGDYLEASVAQLDGVERMSCDVQAIAREAGGLRLIGRECVVEARRVVLALGPGIPESSCFQGDPRLVSDPWGALPVIHPNALVLLVGTGLTAIDVMHSLEAAGHVGPMIAVSRHGLLPEAHAAGALPDWSRAIAADSTVRGFLRSLRWEVTLAPDWRVVLDALRPRLREIWTAWSIAEQRRFLRHARRFWEVRRHRLAPVVAAQVDAWRRAGRLEVVAGRVRPAGNGAVELGNSRGVCELRPALAVNCTGPSLDPLVGGGLRRRLLDDGLAERHPTGLGFRASAEGEVSPGLFAVGALLVGERWESTAIPEIRAQAAALADRLAGS